jgi:hypothetical protein
VEISPIFQIVREAAGMAGDFIPQFRNRGVFIAAFDLALACRSV